MNTNAPFPLPIATSKHCSTFCLCVFLGIYVSGGSGDLVAKSCLTLTTPWTGACQAPLSMGFLRQAYWSGLPFPAPGDLPDPGKPGGIIYVESYSVYPFKLYYIHIILFYVSGIIQYLSLCAWFITLSLMSSRFIHIVACIRISF